MCTKRKHAWNVFKQHQIIIYRILALPRYWDGQTSVFGEAYIDYILSRVKPLLYSLGKLRFFITQETSIQVYNTYILPLLESGIYLIESNSASEAPEQNT